MVKRSLDLVLQSYFEHVFIVPEIQDTYQARNVFDLKPEPNPKTPRNTFGRNSLFKIIKFLNVSVLATSIISKNKILFKENSI